MVFLIYDRGKKNCDSNDGNGLAALHVGAVENKLNRLPALKDSKLFHPVQLTPPIYLARREWIAEWSSQDSGTVYQKKKKKERQTVVVTSFAPVRYTLPVHRCASGI